MARAVLSEVIQTTSGAIVPTGTAVQVVQLDGSTPIADTMYSARTGGVPLANPLITSSLGRVTAYTDVPQLVMLKPTGGTATLAQFLPDWDTIPTLTSVGTFTNKKLEHLETPLVDGLTGFSAGYDQVGLAIGSPTSVFSRHPVAQIQVSGYPNSMPTAVLAGTALMLEQDRYGSVLQALATSTGSNTSTTLNDTTKTWTVNGFSDAGGQVDIVSGTGAGQTAAIVSNTATQLTVSPAWAVTPDATSTYIINKGGAADTQTLIVMTRDYGTSKPSNRAHQTLGFTIKTAGMAPSSTGALYGGIILVQSGTTSNDGIGLEIDSVNASGAAASVWGAGVTNSSVGLNLLSFTQGAGSQYNSLAIVVQGNGPTGGYYNGFSFAPNSVATYVNSVSTTGHKGIAIDFRDLTVGSTSPVVWRLGSGHAWVGRNNANTGDVVIGQWISDVLHHQADDIRLNAADGTNRLKLNSAGLSLNNALFGLRFKGNFSHGTNTNRLMFQANQTNGATFVGAIPDGSGGASAWFAYGGSDPDNASFIDVFAIGTTSVGVEAGKNGTGTYTPLNFLTTATQRLQIAANGDIVPGTGALATNAIAGFLFIPSSAGPPTGTPTAYAGRVPLHFDATNFRLYVYVAGAWIKSAALT